MFVYKIVSPRCVVRKLASYSKETNINGAEKSIKCIIVLHSDSPFKACLSTFADFLQVTNSLF